MKSKNILKNLSAIGLSDVIGTGATAFFWFYLASVISPENYGEIFFYLGIATLISSIVLIANQNTITVYLAKKIKLQSTLYVITLIATVIASFVIINPIELIPFNVSFLIDCFIRKVYSDCLLKESI